MKKALLMAGLALSTGANAGNIESTGVDSAALLNYCPVDTSVLGGEIVKIAGEFGPRIQAAIEVSPEDLRTAQYKAASALNTKALKELSVAELSKLAERVKLLSNTDVNDPQAVENGIKAAEEILEAIEVKRDTLWEMVYKDQRGVLNVNRVGVNEKTLRKADLELAFTDLSETGMKCSDIVKTYTSDKESFPSISEAGMADFEAYRLTAESKFAQPTAASRPLSAFDSKNSKESHQFPRDVMFMKALTEVLQAYEWNDVTKTSGLDHDAKVGIQLYGDYVYSLSLVAN